MKTENQTKNLNKMDNQRELYLSPQLEVFEIKVEKGFATSGLGGDQTTSNGWTETPWN